MVRTIILAAGASSRMGRSKAALPLGRGETFLSRIVRTAIAAQLPEIVIVSGADPAAIAQATIIRDRRVRIVHNPAWETGQLSSLLAGLNLPSRVTIEAALVTLVDVPLSSRDTIARLLAAWRETRRPIVRPARGDEHGHPVIFDAALFDELRTADPSKGAKSVVRAHEAEILNLPIDDPGAFLDIDTPEEYVRAMQSM